MPIISAVSKIDFPYKTEQQEVKKHALEMFSANFPEANRLIFAFDNTEIIFRNFCQPLSYYTKPNTFEERNDEYIRTTLEYSVLAIEECVKKAGVDKNDITDILFVSTTGL